MTKLTTVTGATLALLMSSAAWAQQPPTKTETPSAAPQMSEPSQSSPPAAAKAAAGSSQAGRVVFVERQKPNERLVSELKGLGVKNSADEAVGSVSDLVIDADGKVSAILVGVGGFLGIGVSDIAVAYDTIELTTSKDGGRVVRINATRESLDMAPRFMTVKAQADLERARQQQLQQQQQQSTKPAMPNPTGRTTPESIGRGCMIDRWQMHWNPNQISSVSCTCQLSIRVGR